MITELRAHGPSVFVAALAATFGVVLLQVTTALATIIAADDILGSSAAVVLTLSVVALVFIAIATYVGAVVTANTFATIIAGRIRTIALMRLIGDSAAGQRRQVAREGLLVGIVGALVGLALGIVLPAIGLVIAVAAGVIPALPYSLFEPVILIPVFAVLLTTWAASWVGSRRVLTVSPMRALASAGESSFEQVASRRARHVIAIVLCVTGALLLAVGMLVGQSSPAGVLVGVVGGILSFTGVVLGAELVMPPALRIVGLLLGRSAPARLAAQNALRYPERSSRTTIGLVIGVTLVTMFAVAGETFQHVVGISPGLDPDELAQVQQTLLGVVIVFSVLIGFSAVIAAAGMVNNLSLSVVQRTRELGLLRALGFTTRQLRAMILAESAQLAVASVGVGLVLGTLYGWAGAQSMFATMPGVDVFVVPAVPAGLIAAVVASAAVLTVVASITPSRRATAITPVRALAVE